MSNRSSPERRQQLIDAIRSVDENVARCAEEIDQAIDAVDALTPTERAAWSDSLDPLRAYARRTAVLHGTILRLIKHLERS